MGLGWRMGQVQVLVPDWCHPLQYITKHRALRGGSLRSIEAMLLSSCLFFCKMGPVVPAASAPQGLQPGFERNRAQACNSVHMELQQFSPALCCLRNSL